MKTRRPSRTVIMGAAGRDFHDFLRLYRDDPSSEVVAFTAAQIPGIADRRFPASLAGSRYPDGIPIEPQSALSELCRKHQVERVHFAYSDISHAEVMHVASVALAHGAEFIIPAPTASMIGSPLPVIATSAVRTGCGKSQLTRWLVRRLRERGWSPVVIRHPMPYGDLAAQAAQRFATLSDLDVAQCTVEEREEYEPHLAMGTTVHAGVDYEAIVTRAADDGDILLWDGGNNDFPFVLPDLHLVLVDPLRPGGEYLSHPGEAVLRTADIVIVAKVDAAADADVQALRESARTINPTAPIINARSPVTVDHPERLRGKRVLVVEDGPTLTHGGMGYGAGYVAAVQAGASEIIDPRVNADPGVAAVYEAYPHIGRVLPAVGYFPEQLRSLERSIAASEAEVVLSATPCDLSRLIAIDRPWCRATYEFAEFPGQILESALEKFLAGPAQASKTSDSKIDRSQGVASTAPAS